MDAISVLYPGYFAMVMATGVVGIQAQKLGYGLAAKIFYAVGVIAYLTLWGLCIVRLVRFPAKIGEDFRSFAKCPAFFTLSAATSVLGKGALLILHLPAIAVGLWIFTWCIWGILIYAFAMNVFTSQDNISIHDHVNGVWLIIPVATQSLSILTTLLSPVLPDHRLMMLVSLSLYMLGCGLYLIVIAVVLYRLAFFSIKPEEFRPAYWVCMGSAAISTLAGVELTEFAKNWQLPFEPLSSLQGFAMFFWVIASAWIPLLVGLGIWRHAVRKVPLSYDPQYWSMVFPLAMYAICTGGIVEIFKFTSLQIISQAFLVIAAVAWTFTFFGLIKCLVMESIRTLALANNPFANGAKST